MADKNPITGDLLQSRMNTKEFEENFDRIFRKNETIDPVKKPFPHNIFRQRINEQKLNNDDMLPEYELNKSTGEVQKVYNGKDNTNSTEPS